MQFHSRKKRERKERKTQGSEHEMQKQTEDGNTQWLYSSILISGEVSHKKHNYPVSCLSVFFPSRVTTKVHCNHYMLAY